MAIKQQQKRQLNRRAKRRGSALHKTHLHEVAALLNKELNVYGIAVTVDTSMQSTKAIHWFEKAYQERDLVRGQMTPQQIKAFADVLACFLQKEGKKLSFMAAIVAVVAATMSGKTGFGNLLSYLPLMIHLLTKRAIIYTRLLLNDNHLESQSILSDSGFRVLYSRHLRFQYKNEEPYTLEDFEEDSRAAFQELHDFVDETDKSRQIYRTSCSQEPHFQGLMEHAKKLGIHLIALCDESHARVDMGSVLNRMVMDADHKFADVISYIGMSATNHAFQAYCSELGHPIVVMEPGPGYTGLGWIMGRKFDMIRPKVMSLVEFSGIDLSSIKESKKLKLDNWAGDILGWMAFCKKWVKEIHKLARFCLIGRGVPGVAKSKGMLIRALVHNGTMSEIVQKLNAASKGEIQYILFNQENKPEKTSGSTALERTIEDVAGPKHKRKPYVVLVTGAARLGMEVPKDCKYGLEFTNKMVGQVLEQSITGRLTGYGKGVTCIILSEYSAEVLRRYMKTGRWQRPVNRVWRECSPYPRHLQDSRLVRTMKLFRHELPEKEVAKLEEFANSVARPKSEKELQGGSGFSVQRHDNGNKKLESCHLRSAVKLAKSNGCLPCDMDKLVSCGVRMDAPNRRTNLDSFSSEGRFYPVIVVEVLNPEASENKRRFRFLSVKLPLAKHVFKKRKLTKKHMNGNGMYESVYDEDTFEEYEYDEDMGVSW